MSEADTLDLLPEAAPKKSKPHHVGHRQRLRERFLKAPGAVADYELLEILLFAARPVGDVKPIAKNLVAQFKSISNILNADAKALLQVEGMNDAGVAALKAVKVTAEKLLREDIADKPLINNWTALLDYCRITLGHKKEEEFHVLFLNHKLGLIADEMQQRGTVDHTPVYPREVVKRALELGATGLILMHNHPSGDVTPSKADIEMTKHIVAAAKPLHITVHDHLVIGAKAHYSFKSHGLL